MEEIPLSGGRVTAGVVRAGDTVRRPCCPNSPFVHRVLSFLEEKDAPAPRFLGLDDRGREIISFLPGQVPDNLGYFSEEQLSAAGKLIRTLHDALSDFPDCSPGETVCHRDLSPCNFLFTGGLPAFVIDWDAAMVGNPLDDLAYALWMWLDMGNRGNPPRDTARRAKFLLDGYGLEPALRPESFRRIRGQMERVAQSVFPTREQTAATRAWAESCLGWLREYRALLEKESQAEH